MAACERAGQSLLEQAVAAVGKKIEGSACLAPGDIVSGGPASEGGIYKSIDGGDTWKHITNGLPKDLIGKIDIDIARSNPRVLYAMVEGLGNQGGLYRSSDAGESPG